MSLDFYKRNSELLRDISLSVTSQKTIKKQLKILRPKTFSCQNPDFIRLPRVNLDNQLTFFRKRSATLYYIFKIKNFSSKVSDC